jgi:hypothetical protein
VNRRAGTIELVDAAHLTRPAEPVRVGVPLAADAEVFEPQTLFLEDERSRRIPCQALVLSRWPGGSAKWLLVDFVAETTGEEVTRYALWTDPSAEAGRSRDGEGAAGAGRSGAGAFRLRPGAPSDRVLAISQRGGGAAELEARLELTRLDGTRARAEVHEVSEEQEGPVRRTTVVRGSISAARGADVRFLVRCDVFEALDLCRLEVGLHNPRAALHPGGLWDLGDAGSALFRDLSLVLSGVTPEEGVEWQAEPALPVECCRGPWRLVQESSGGANWDSPVHVDAAGRPTVSGPGYRVEVGEGPPGGRKKEGRRAVPWVQTRWDGGWVAAGVEDFWQNFPKALESSGNELRVGLFPEGPGAPFELQGGERKRHVVWIQLGTDGRSCALPHLLVPLVPRVPPDEVFRTAAVPFLVPAEQDGNRSYLEYVQGCVEGPHSQFDKREAVDEYGWRNFGDLWGDHEAVHHRGPRPFVSHYNNQYDFVYAAFVHYLRTGDIRWRRLMDDLARHVADIDIYRTQEDKAAYNNGLFWHTDHYRQAGRATHRTFSADGLSRAERRRSGGGPSNEHNYTSGLLHHHWLTGDPGSGEAVLELADWVVAMDDGARTLLGLLDDGPTGGATQTVSRDYHGPGRGAGNSINALLDAFQLCGRRGYLEKAEAFLRRCVHPQDDISVLELDGQPEYRWSYLVFLQILGKYLDLKRSRSEQDYAYFYARDSLLRYARWMVGNEVPYKDVLHKVEIPTETWPAQDIRKAHVLNQASRYAPPAEKEALRRKARFFFDRCLEDLLGFETAHLTRPQVLLAAYGWIQAYFDAGAVEEVPFEDHGHDFGAPVAFRPQRARLRGTLRRKTAVAGAELARVVRQKLARRRGGAAG